MKEARRDVTEYPVFIGPESDHCLLLSLPDSLIDSRLINLIDVTLAFEDASSKLVEVVTTADVDNEALAAWQQFVADLDAEIWS